MLAADSPVHSLGFKTFRKETEPTAGSQVAKIIPNYFYVIFFENFCRLLELEGQFPSPPPPLRHHWSVTTIKAA